MARRWTSNPSERASLRDRVRNIQSKGEVSRWLHRVPRSLQFQPLQLTFPWETQSPCRTDLGAPTSLFLGKDPIAPKTLLSPTMYMMESSFWDAGSPKSEPEKARVA